MNYHMMNHVVNHLLDVDSYGPVFMYATNRDLTTAPRHIIRMAEPVDPELLREALKIALLRFPQMGLGLERGETQYRYRLLTDPPVVLPFDDISPYYIGSEDTNGYLFCCGYRENTIYLEYQHCTSDGRGPSSALGHGISGISKSFPVGHLLINTSANHSDKLLTPFLTIRIKPRIFTQRTHVNKLSLL